MTPKLRYIINHNKEVKREKLNAIVYIDELKLLAQGYSGKRGKNDFLYRFKTLAGLLNHVENYFKNLKTNQDYKKERKESRLDYIAKQAESLKIGDILYNSWGYDQTNVDFYQVINKQGKRLLIQKIASRVEDSPGLSPMSGYAYPLKDQFLSDYEPAWILAGKYNKTDETKKHYISWYA